MLAKIDHISSTSLKNVWPIGSREPQGLFRPVSQESSITNAILKTFMSLLLGGDGLVNKSCPTLVTPLTVVFQALLSMGFSRQAYWSGLLFPFPGDLLDPRIKPRCPALQEDSLPTELQGKTLYYLVSLLFLYRRLHSLKQVSPPKPQQVSINIYILIQVQVRKELVQCLQLQCRNYFSFLGELKGQPTLIELLLYSGVLGDSASQESACSARDPCLISGLGRSPGEGNGYPLQCSCLENSVDREAWWAARNPWGCQKLDTTWQLANIFHAHAFIFTLNLCILLACFYRLEGKK